MNHGVI